MVSFVFFSVVVFLSFVACITDLRGLKIPNIIPLLIACLFIVYMGYQIVSGVEYKNFTGNIITGSVVFAVTFILFSLNMFGAGDAKLTTAISLWLGSSGIVAFLFFMAVTGGVLGIVTLILLKTEIPKKYPKGWFECLADGRPDIPYAIAIFVGCAAGFLQVYLR